jgi:hypothetical protein
MADNPPTKKKKKKKNKKKNSTIKTQTARLAARVEIAGLAGVLVLKLLPRAAAEAGAFCR